MEYTSLRIGDVARRTGLRTSTIRYYERLGLIPAPRRVRGQRRYSADVLTHVAIVRKAQEVGFTLDEIRTLVAGFPDGMPAGDRWRDLACRTLPEVDAMIHRLHGVRRILQESLACGCPNLDACAAMGWDLTGIEQPRTP